MKRPEVTPEIIMKAAEKTAAETSNLSLEEKAELANAIVQVYRTYMNGFDLAKALDRNGWDDIDTMFVEDIDAMGFNVDTIHKEVCFAWVKENNIQPPFEIGTTLDIGVITGISDHMPAYFEVKLTGHDDAKDGYSRRLLKFEDAVSA
ncbi:hypothetical protein [Endozoicomonas sp. ALB091]|uniref:hypothetical protein n=1 Tax=Endozoicomonas sp. ALB091 TaxID=3403073 RepID=UPI003BB56ABE